MMAVVVVVTSGGLRRPRTDATRVPPDRHARGEPHDDRQQIPRPTHAPTLSPARSVTFFRSAHSVLAHTDRRAMIKSAPDEMTEVFTSCGGQLWRSLLAASAGRQDIADDITAEAFPQYRKQRDTVRDPLAYMFRVAYRLLAKELALEQRQVPRSPDRVEAAHAQSVLSPMLTDALLGLSVEQRFAVVLHYFLDYTVS